GLGDLERRRGRPRGAVGRGALRSKPRFLDGREQAGPVLLSLLPAELLPARRARAGAGRASAARLAAIDDGNAPRERGAVRLVLPDPQRRAARRGAQLRVLDVARRVAVTSTSGEGHLRRQTKRLDRA